PSPCDVCALSLHDALPICAGDELLAGAALAEHEDGGVGGRDSLDEAVDLAHRAAGAHHLARRRARGQLALKVLGLLAQALELRQDRKSTRLNSSHVKISYA